MEQLDIREYTPKLTQKQFDAALAKGEYPAFSLVFKEYLEIGGAAGSEATRLGFPLLTWAIFSPKNYKARQAALRKIERKFISDLNKAVDLDPINCPYKWRERNPSAGGQLPSKKPAPDDRRYTYLNTQTNECLSKGQKDYSILMGKSREENYVRY